MRSPGIKIMGKLIVLVGSMLPVMLLAVFLGTAGHLCAISLTAMAAAGLFLDGSLRKLFFIIGAAALLRSVLHYGEQQCNHYIAFKLLAQLRHRVFAKLRLLCPAKLEGKDRGDLISMITSDIELLEVFYAHTISPIAIAVLVSLTVLGILGSIHPLCVVPALAGYLTVGVLLPVVNSARGKETGVEYRAAFSDLNSRMLEDLRGLREHLQFGTADACRERLKEDSMKLSGLQSRLSGFEADQSRMTGAAILFFSLCQLFLAVILYKNGALTNRGLLLGVTLTMGSFGPVTALSSLSNNLTQTLACGERVLSLLEEAPETEKTSGGKDIVFSGAVCGNVHFSYGKGSDAAEILKGVSVEIPKGRILGIHGSSGCGKSTLLRLLMRFWDVSSGRIYISGEDIRTVNTENLREMESLVTQETVLFHDTIAGNIAVGRIGATREEIIAAAKKASLHDFIESLPNGYETQVAELGASLSGGERQRIGIARAFLHDAPFLLLDEPTSNLDSLNEGIILKSLCEEGKDRTIVLVSHRRSTLNVADGILEMEAGTEIG